MTEPPLTPASPSGRPTVIAVYQEPGYWAGRPVNYSEGPVATAALLHTIVTTRYPKRAGRYLQAAADLLDAHPSARPTLPLYPALPAVKRTTAS